MPMVTITKTVCAYCRNATCDGSMWLWVAVTEKNGQSVGMSIIPAENKGPKCPWCFGRGHQKEMMNKAVGDEVVLYFPNWVRPSHLTVRKVQA